MHTASNYGRQPELVLKFETFDSAVRQYTCANELADYEIYVHLERRQDHRVSDEKNIEEWIKACLSPWQSFLPDNGRLANASALRTVGLPDLIIGDDEQKRLFATIEVRKHNVLRIEDGEHLAAVYQDVCRNEATNRNIKRCVEQAFGYMVTNKVQYGAHSTYQQTWIRHRPAENPMHLFISSTINHRTAGREMTFRRCMTYFASLALAADLVPAPPQSGRTSRRSGRKTTPTTIPTHSPTSSPLSNPRHRTPDVISARSSRNCWRSKSRSRRSSRGARGTKRVHVEQDVDITLGPVLGTGRCGITFAGWLYDTSAAIKLVDPIKRPEAAKALQHEMEMYEKLSDFQGKVIPKLIGRGVMDGMLEFLAMEPINPGVLKVWGEEERSLARAAVGQLHEAGFVHGDIRVQNVLFEGTGKERRAVLIDLEMVKKGVDADFREDELALAAYRST
ncbi:hypothetical protein BC832DRAFT_594845 [Gaertneriomyces semiglobifer]|nr:hypothetical protein BC832DRAFT_594845 [Gaertneriomyces semiglobifer]